MTDEKKGISIQIKRGVGVMLSVKHIYKKLGNFKLCDINFEVKRGEYFVILGPSGTGKTVVLETIAGVYNIDKGNISSNTVHCKDKEPENCALELPSFIKERYGNPKIALIGFQPAMLEKLSKSFHVRIVDLDINNINTVKYGVLVENGYKHTEDLLEWCDIILAIGSTVANNTITSLFVDKPIAFFGTTLAGTAELMGLERFCPCSQ
jgi:ABC-type phosphate/phosphonate transport system ATPase subunit